MVMIKRSENERWKLRITILTEYGYHLVIMRHDHYPTSVFGNKPLVQIKAGKMPWAWAINRTHSFSGCHKVVTTETNLHVVWKKRETNQPTNQEICTHVERKQTLSSRPRKSGIRGPIAESRGSRFKPLKSGDLRKAVCALGRRQQLSAGAVFLTGDIQKEKQLWGASRRRESNCLERRNNSATSVTVIRMCYCYRFRRASQIKKPN